MNYDTWLKAVPLEITGDPLCTVEAYRLALNFYYTDLLGRAPDAAGIQNFFAALQNSQFTPAGISTVFLASDEFFQRAVRFAGG